MIEFEKAEQRRGTTDIITVYKPTFAGHLIALLIETMESGKQPAISTEIYHLFGTYFKDHFSSYDVFYAKLFKKYKDNGLFDEFGVDTLISRLNSGREIRTINNLVQRLDLLYFDDAKKAKLYVELLIEVLKELKPKVKRLLLYEIKLILQQEMATRVRALHKDFDERCFELRERPDVIVLEGNCQKCDYYLMIDCEILHYLKRSNLSPHTALNGVKCPRCKEDKCIINHSQTLM